MKCMPPIRRVVTDCLGTRLVLGRSENGGSFKLGEFFFYQRSLNAIEMREIQDSGHILQNIASGKIAFAPPGTGFDYLKTENGKGFGRYVGVLVCWCMCVYRCVCVCVSTCTPRPIPIPMHFHVHASKSFASARVHTQDTHVHTQTQTHTSTRMDIARILKARQTVTMRIIVLWLFRCPACASQRSRSRTRIRHYSSWNDRGCVQVGGCSRPARRRRRRRR